MLSQAGDFPSGVWSVLQWAFTIISTVVTSVAMFILRDLMQSRHTHAQRITENATNVEWLMRTLESQHKENVRRLDDIQRQLETRRGEHRVQDTH